MKIKYYVFSLVPALLFPTLSFASSSMEELEELTLEREANLGLERVYSKDGSSYTYALSEYPELGYTVTEGAMTWEYIGQASFETSPTLEGESWSKVPNYVLTSMDYDADEYFGVGTQHKVDQFGHRWRLKEIDPEVARDMIDVYNIESESTGAIEKGVERGPGIEYPDNPGEERYSVAHGWTVSDCSAANPGYEVTEHSSDGLNLVSATYNTRLRKIVLIQTTAGGFCTGTMVDSDWVLTAAHCIANSTGEFSPSIFTVCTYGDVQSAAECFGVTTVEAKGNVADGSWENDYGLLQLDGEPGVGIFSISQASDSVIEPWTDYHRGYPGFRPSCASNITWNDSTTIDDDFAGVSLHKTDGGIQSTSTGYVKFDTSSASAMSGGPHYYCPYDYDSDGEYCEHGHWITAVTKGYYLYWLFGWHGYVGGPKGRDFRDWVINNTP